MLSDPRQPTLLLPVLGTATLKATPDDFRVCERLGFEPSGRGEHLFFFIEKREMNSHDVAVELAELCHVPRKAVSFAGRKDKRAVTRQWFSVHRIGMDRPRLADQSNWRVLEVTRHSKHLPKGALAANRFDVLLRDVSVDPDALQRQWSTVCHGVPNYFGPQRFGLRNLERAQQGQTEEMVVSAARAAVFNRMLDARVKNGSWLLPEPGEPCLRRDSNGWVNQFTAGEIETGTVDPCLPLFGPVPGVSDALQQMWKRQFEIYAQDLLACLNAQSFRPLRRRVRLIPDRPSLEIHDEGIRMSATLGPGSFMTSLLGAMFELKEPHVANFDQ